MYWSHNVSKIGHSVTVTLPLKLTRASSTSLTTKQVLFRFSWEGSVMSGKGSDDDSPKAAAIEKTQKSVILVVLVNAILFSSCFFMVESVFPVSLCKLP